jgi:hypothetical protein
MSETTTSQTNDATETAANAGGSPTPPEDAREMLRLVEERNVLDHRTGQLIEEKQRRDPDPDVSIDDLKAEKAAELREEAERIQEEVPEEDRSTMENIVVTVETDDIDAAWYREAVETAAQKETTATGEEQRLAEMVTEHERIAQIEEGMEEISDRREQINERLRQLTYEREESDPSQARQALSNAIAAEQTAEDLDPDTFLDAEAQTRTVAERIRNGETPSPSEVGLEADPGREGFVPGIGGRDAQSAEEASEQPSGSSTRGAGGYEPSEDDVEAAAEAAAALRLSQEAQGEKRKATKKFLDRATQAYDDPDRAREAYNEMAEAYDEERARQVLLDPDRHQGESEAPRAFSDPGSLNASEDTLEDLKDLDATIRDNAARKDIFEDYREAAAEQIDDRPDEIPKEKIDDAADRLRQQAEQKRAEQRADRYRDLNRRQAEANETAEELNDLMDILSVQGKTARERAENAREAANEVYDDLADSLDEIYEDGEGATKELETNMWEKDFGYAMDEWMDWPESIGDTQDGKGLGWETRATADAGDSEVEMYLNGIDSPGRDAAEMHLREAVASEMEIRYAMEKSGASRSEVKASMDPEDRERVEKAQDVLENAREAVRERKIDLATTPGDHHDGDIDRLEAMDDGVAKRAQKQGAISSSEPSSGQVAAAIAVEETDEDLQQMVDDLFQNPAAARDNINEALAQGTGRDPETELERMTLDPSQYGDLDDEEIKQKAKDRADRKGPSKRRWARYGEEIGEMAVEQGPDEETEAGLKKVRMLGSAAGAAAGAMAAAAGKRFRERRERRKMKNDMKEKVGKKLAKKADKHRKAVDRYDEHTSEIGEGASTDTSRFSRLQADARDTARTARKHMDKNRWAKVAQKMRSRPASEGKVSVNTPGATRQNGSTSGPNPNANPSRGGGSAGRPGGSAPSAGDSSSRGSSGRDSSSGSSSADSDKEKEGDATKTKTSRKKAASRDGSWGRGR